MRKNKFLAALAIAACLATSVPLSASAATLGQAASASEVTYGTVSVADQAKIKEIFVAADYAELNPDLVAAGLTGDALFNHFIKSGLFEGRQCNKNFNVAVYRSAYADLQKEFGNDLVKYYVHYAAFGKAEGRKLTTVEAAKENGVEVKSLFSDKVILDKVAAPAASTSSSNSGSTTPAPTPEKEEETKPAPKPVEIKEEGQLNLATNLNAGYAVTSEGIYYLEKDADKNDLAVAGAVTHLGIKEDINGFNEYIKLADGTYHRIIAGNENSFIDGERYGAQRQANGTYKYYIKNTAQSLSVAAELKFDSDRYYKVSDTEYHEIVSKEEATELNEKYGYVVTKDLQHNIYFINDTTDGGFIYTAKKGYFAAADGKYYKFYNAYNAALGEDEPEVNPYDIDGNLTLNDELYNDGTIEGKDHKKVVVKKVVVTESELKKGKLKANFHVGQIDDAQASLFGCQKGTTFYYTTLDWNTISAAGLTYVQPDSYLGTAYESTRPQAVVAVNPANYKFRVGVDEVNGTEINYFFVTKESAYEYTDNGLIADVTEKNAKDLVGKYVVNTLPGAPANTYVEVVSTTEDAQRTANYAKYYKLSDPMTILEDHIINKNDPEVPSPSGAQAEIDGKAEKKVDTANFVDIADDSKYLNIHVVVGRAANNVLIWSDKKVSENNTARGYAGINAKQPRKLVSEDVVRRLNDSEYGMAVRDGETIYYRLKPVDLSKTSVIDYVAKPGYVRVYGNDIVAPTFMVETDYATAFDSKRFGSLNDKSTAYKTVYYYADKVDASVATEAKVGFKSVDERTYVHIVGDKAYKIVEASEAIKYDPATQKLVCKNGTWYVQELK